MESVFTLPSFAKINWTLRIVGKRADGFHELFTIFQTVSLFDSISFASAGGLALTCDDPRVPTDERNLIVQAAIGISHRFDVRLGASIHLKKHIPFPGGLGGGSSNAAVALIGLSRLWGLDVSSGELAEMAAGLGSDVPFFLEGGTAVGVSRGQILEQVGEMDESYMLIVTPNVKVSTRDAFERLKAPTLTNVDTKRILRVCRTEAESLDLRQSVLINDFEASVFAAFPEIERVKKTLFDLGAVNAALSGSGASVFAIFDKTETRQAAIKALDHESTWRKFAVATVSRSEYRDMLHL